MFVWSMLVISRMYPVVRVMWPIVNGYNSYIPTALLRGSFRPSADIVTLRTYVRHRDNIIKGRVVHIQHMQKGLELMNLKLTQVVTDITGVTGMQIIRAIIDGEHDPHVLAQFRDYRCAKSETEIARALHGQLPSRTSLYVRASGLCL